MIEWISSDNIIIWTKWQIQIAMNLFQSYKKWFVKLFIWLGYIVNIFTKINVCDQNKRMLDFVAKMLWYIGENKFTSPQNHVYIGTQLMTYSKVHTWAGSELRIYDMKGRRFWVHIKSECWTIIKKINILFK